MHYYSHHIDSYTSATRHLTPMEDLAYRRMLDVYYRDEGPLQGDAAAVARRVGLREFVESVAVVLAEFFTETGAGWRQQRCEEELANYRQVVERNRANGGLGGRPKKPTGFPVGSQSVPTGNPLGTQSKPTGNPPNPTPNPTPTPNSESLSPQTPPSPASLPVASLPFMNEGEPEPAEKPKKPKAALIEAVVADTAFQRFWTAYDLKKGRDEAAKSWGRIAPDQQLAEAIVAAARWYAEDNPDKAFRKHPATWLNQKGWLDERVSKGGANAKPQDGGFDNFGRWKGVPRGKVDYSVGLGEDDPEHPKQLLANENGIRASRSLPPLTMDEWKAMGDPRATQGTFTRNTP